MCSSVRRLLITSLSISRKCSGVDSGWLQVILGLPFITTFSFCLHAVGFGKGRERAVEWGRLVHLDALVWELGFQVLG